MTQKPLQCLSDLDRYLTAWIFLAMALGIGFFFPPYVQKINSTGSIAMTSIPFAIGLILVMIPFLAKVSYDGLVNVAFFFQKRLYAAGRVKWVSGKMDVGECRQTIYQPTGSFFLKEP